MMWYDLLSCCNTRDAAIFQKLLSSGNQNFYPTFAKVRCIVVSYSGIIFQYLVLACQLDMTDVSPFLAVDWLTTSSFSLLIFIWLPDVKVVVKAVHSLASFS
jgi:hypothetical protein